MRNWRSRVSIPGAIMAGIGVLFLGAVVHEEMHPEHISRENSWKNILKPPQAYYAEISQLERESNRLREENEELRREIERFKREMNQCLSKAPY